MNRVTGLIRRGPRLTERAHENNNWWAGARYAAHRLHPGATDSAESHEHGRTAIPVGRIVAPVDRARFIAVQNAPHGKRNEERDSRLVRIPLR